MGRYRREREGQRMVHLRCFRADQPAELSTFSKTTYPKLSLTFLHQRQFRSSQRADHQNAIHFPNGAISRARPTPHNTTKSFHPTNTSGQPSLFVGANLQISKSARCSKLPDPATRSVWCCSTQFFSHMSLCTLPGIGSVRVWCNRSPSWAEELRGWLFDCEGLGSWEGMLGEGYKEAVGPMGQSREAYKCLFTTLRARDS